MEEKDSAISGPYEEFRICFCGKTPSEFVQWYLLDVSVKKARLSEKTESSERKLNPFSESMRLSSYAALGGLIYSLGGRYRSCGGDDTLRRDVWLLDYKSFVDLKPGSILRQPGSIRRQPDSGKAYIGEDLKPSSILSQPSSDKAHIGEYWKEDWEFGRIMNFARYNPHTMVVDHKLYVLGGFLPNQKADADGWIEVFDPEKEKWESLPSPPDEFQIHSSIMISGLLKSKKEIIIAKRRWDCRPLLFFSYNITTRCWNELSLHSDSKASAHSNVERAVILHPNIGRAVTVGNTLYWISTEEHNDECTIQAYDLDRNMWFEGHLNTATIFGMREYFSSIYSRGPGFLHLVDQKFCLLLQSTVTRKKSPQSSIEYLYCVILNISPIYEDEDEDEDWGEFELTIVSVQKYYMDRYIDFLDCMLLDRVSGVKPVDRRGQSTSTNISFQK